MIARLVIALPILFTLLLPATLSLLTMMVIRLLLFLGIPLLIAGTATFLVGVPLSMAWTLVLASTESPAIGDTESGFLLLGLHALLFLAAVVIAFLTVGRWIRRAFERFEDDDVGGHFAVRLVWIGLNTAFALTVLVLALSARLSATAGEPALSWDLLAIAAIPGLVWGLLCGTFLTRWVFKIWGWVGDADMSVPVSVPVYIRHF
jgi:hypothetical protein